MRTKKKTVAKRPNTKAAPPQAWNVHLFNGDFIATFQETQQGILKLFKGARIEGDVVRLA